MCFDSSQPGAARPTGMDRSSRLTSAAIKNEDRPIIESCSYYAAASCAGRTDRREPLDHVAIPGRVGLGGNGRDCDLAAPAARAVVVWWKTRPRCRADDYRAVADSD